LETGLAWRDGRAVPGLGLRRRFELSGAGLEVEEQLSSDEPPRGLGFRWPSAASERREDGPLRRAYRLS
jgi:hypothetical protein